MGSIIRCLLILFVVLHMCGCEKSPDDSPIRIGLIPYLTGEGRETTGLDMLTATQMAVEKFNREGGVLIGKVRRPLVLEVVGIEHNAEQATHAALELINEHQVVAIIGPQYSSDAIAAGGVAEQAKVPLIAPIASHPDVTRGRNYVFRGTFIDAQQAEAMAVFAREELRATRAAIVYDESDPYSRGLAGDYRRVFTRQGGQVVLSAGVVGDELLDDQLWQRVAHSGAEILYLPIYHPMSGKAADAARAAGFTGRLLGSDAWDSRFDASRPSMQGSFMAASWSRKLEMPETKNFIREFREKSGREPGDAPALTYDAVTLLAEVMQRQGSIAGEALRQGLLDAPPFQGVAGSLDYVSDGNPIKAVIIVELRDGDALFHKFVVL